MSSGVPESFLSPSDQVLSAMLQFLWYPASSIGRSSLRLLPRVFQELRTFWAFHPFFFKYKLFHFFLFFMVRSKNDWRMIQPNGRLMEDLGLTVFFHPLCIDESLFKSFSDQFLSSVVVAPCVLESRES